MNFFRTPFFLPWLYPQLTWRIPTEEKIIYLTFDDGPIPGPTEFVLETLKSKNIQATFFCIGDNIFRHGSIYDRLRTDGHAPGNHTFNHVNGWKTPLAQYKQNVEHCRQIMSSNTTLFRPPYGRIKGSQIKMLAHYSIIMWDVLTYDFDQSVSPDQCLKGSIAATRKGSIVVFHDSLKAERNMSYALPRYIDHFTSLGYSFKTLSP